MRVGILGGSFNPPHIGHIKISLEAKKMMNLDEIWWEPTKQNPFKKEFCNFEEKLQKSIEITKKYPNIIIKNHENNLKSNITIDLLKEIIKNHSEINFFWIMGADTIIDFHLWEEWKEIINISPLIICDRDNYSIKAKNSIAYKYAKSINKATFLKINKIDISSTNIRKL